MAGSRLFAGAALMAALAFSGGAQAQTISYADAMSDLAQACGADIRKHCQGVNLGNDAIQQCLAKHQSSVSQQCTSTLASVTASIARRLKAQASVFKVCASHANTLCKGVHGEANILALPHQDRAHRRAEMQPGHHRRRLALNNAKG